jgi:DNA-binding FadR family transcriptional regulator
VAPRKRNQIDGQFSARLIEMMESPAYRVLSLSAHRVQDRIAVELGHHGGNDNGKLPVTYEQFMEYGIDRQAIAPAIRELEALGFIEVTQRGRPSAGEFRWPNLFRLTWINSRSSNNPTHEWRRVATIEAAEQLARAARKAKARKKIPRVENPHCASRENPHCHDQSPGLKTPPTVLGLETHTTSISRDITAKAVSEARPSRCAVASERPAACSR